MLVGMAYLILGLGRKPRGQAMFRNRFMGLLRIAVVGQHCDHIWIVAFEEGSPLSLSWLLCFEFNRFLLTHPTSPGL